MASQASLAKAFTLWMACRVSSTTTLVSAIRSCTSRLSLRMNRPKTTPTMATTGTTASMVSVRPGERAVSSTRPTAMMMVCRTSSASVVVKVSCSSATSALMRLLSSPTRRVAKNAMGSVSRWR